jgi:hypothetical protein
MCEMEHFNYFIYFMKQQRNTECEEDYELWLLILIINWIWLRITKEISKVHLGCVCDGNSRED